MRVCSIGPTVFTGVAVDQRKAIDADDIKRPNYGGPIWEFSGGISTKTHPNPSTADRSDASPPIRPPARRASSANKNGKASEPAAHKKGKASEPAAHKKGKLSEPAARKNGKLNEQEGQGQRTGRPQERQAQRNAAARTASSAARAPGTFGR
jgi:hypothetical protein